jgi:hypothetical protein
LMRERFPPPVSASSLIRAAAGLGMSLPTRMSAGFFASKPSFGHMA